MINKIEATQNGNAFDANDVSIESNAGKLTVVSHNIIPEKISKSENLTDFVEGLPDGFKIYEEFVVTKYCETHTEQEGGPVIKRNDISFDSMIKKAGFAAVTKSSEFVVEEAEALAPNRTGRNNLFRLSFFRGYHGATPTKQSSTKVETISSAKVQVKHTATSSEKQDKMVTEAETPALSRTSASKGCCNIQ